MFNFVVPAFVSCFRLYLALLLIVVLTEGDGGGGSSDSGSDKASNCDTIMII